MRVSLQVLCFPVHIAFLFYFVLGFSMGIDQLQCNFNLRNITVHWLTCDVINYTLQDALPIYMYARARTSRTVTLRLFLELPAVKFFLLEQSQRKPKIWL